MSLKFVIKEPRANLLFTPTEFYQTLKDLLQNSKHRIVLSCLYIGTGTLEKELMKSIIKNERNENIRIDILLDKQRATRPEGKLKESSVTVLFELFNYCKNININLFHNPLLGSFLYHILPHRVNEMIGVMHMKAFIGDDTIILSGANLSETYLKNRQDRYFLIENKLLADSIHKIINVIQGMSFTLDKNMTIGWKSELINPLTEAHLFREQYYRRIQHILKELRQDISEYYKKKFTYEEYLKYFGSQDEKNTNGRRNKEQELAEEDNPFFFPLFEKNDKKILIIEMALQCGFSIPPIYDESDMIQQLLKNAKNNDQSLIIASGYLNFPQIFLNLFQGIFRNTTLKKGKLQLITASPPANSFYKSEGLSNFIPNAYSAIAYLCIEFITNNISAMCIKGKSEEVVSKSYPSSNDKKQANSNSSTTFSVDLPKKNNEAGTNIYLEYYRPAWTFHSKGMWLINDVKSKKKKSQNAKDTVISQYVEKEKVCQDIETTSAMQDNLCWSDADEQDTTEEMPWSTVIGSSNYGYRATYRDLEMSFLIKTDDHNLKCQLQKELNILYESTKIVQIEELNLRYPKWLKYLVKYIIKWFL